MAQCNFCHRKFASKQGVRAHLRFCDAYQSQKGKGGVEPRRPVRQVSQEAHLKQLFQEARWNQPLPNREPVSPTEQRLASSRQEEERGMVSRSQRSDPQIAEEIRRERERRQLEETRKTQEHKAREERIRQVIQQIKAGVVDGYWQWPDVPMEAKVEAKLAIEKKLFSLPILNLPYYEVWQIGEVVRDRIYVRYPQNQSIQHVQSTNREVNMAMTKLLSGLYFCPQCDDEFDLDRTSESEARCPTCQVALEEDQGDEENDQEGD